MGRIKWPLNKRSGPDFCIIQDPRSLELKVAKEILGEIFDIKSYEVEEMIRLRMEERPLYDREFHVE